MNDDQINSFEQMKQEEVGERYSRKLAWKDLDTRGPSQRHYAPDKWAYDDEYNKCEQRDGLFRKE